MTELRDMEKYQFYLIFVYYIVQTSSLHNLAKAQSSRYRCFIKSTFYKPGKDLQRMQMSIERSSKIENKATRKRQQQENKSKTKTKIENTNLTTYEPLQSLSAQRFVQIYQL